MASYNIYRDGDYVYVDATNFSSTTTQRDFYCRFSSGNLQRYTDTATVKAGATTAQVKISIISLTGGDTSSTKTYTVKAYWSGSEMDVGSYTYYGSGGGGGTVTPEPDDDIYAPIFSDYAVTNVHRDGDYAVFNFEIQIKNPNSTNILVRTQCDFGTNKTYYAPEYNGSGSKPNREQIPGYGYYGVSSTTGNYDISYYVGSATSVKVPVNIYIYYGKVSEGKVNYDGPQVTRTFPLDVPNAYSDFTWGDGSTTISANDTFSTKVTAAKWKELIGLVNKVKGTSISTTGVSTGNALTATSFNNVVSALGLTSTIGTKSKGDKCLASDFNKIRTAYRKAAGLE